ncbi:hypothetical protein D027_4541A, partial [Vibrio parahaemolyticus 861]
MESARL